MYEFRIVEKFCKRKNIAGNFYRVVINYFSFDLLEYIFFSLVEIFDKISIGNFYKSCYDKKYNVL